MNRDAAPRSVDRVETHETGRTAGPHILIVEDEPDYAVGLMNSLKDWRMPLTDSRCMVDIAPHIRRASECLRDDAIDIFVVDLIMKETQNSTTESKQIGEEFVREVIAKTNAGIIVHTSLSEDDAEAAKLLNEGADDYIRKGTTDLKTIQARIYALWRRIQYVRPTKKNLFVHTNRTFVVGDWRFVIGSRTLANSQGETTRLSPTEHAFLRHICTDDNNECDKVNFNLAVLGRRHFERTMRVDNFVYRLRKKLGESVLLLSDDGIYKLVDVREVKPSAA